MPYTPLLLAHLLQAYQIKILNKTILPWHRPEGYDMLRVINSHIMGLSYSLLILYRVYTSFLIWNVVVVEIWAPPFLQSGSCLIESEAGVLVKVYPTVAHGEQPCLRGKKSQGSPDGSFSLTTSPLAQARAPPLEILRQGLWICSLFWMCQRLVIEQ